MDPKQIFDIVGEVQKLRDLVPDWRQREANEIVENIGNLLGETLSVDEKA